MASKTNHTDKKKRLRRPRWNDAENAFLIEHATLMERFGGEMDCGEFAKHMNEHTSLDDTKRLRARRGRNEGEDEFTGSMVESQVWNLEQEEKKRGTKRLPEKAKAKSWVKRPPTEEEITEGLALGTKIAPKISDSGMDGITWDIAVPVTSGPSKEKDHRGLGKQGEKRHEPYSQRIGEPGPSGIAKSRATSGAGRGDGPGMNDRAREDNMLSTRGPSNTPALQQKYIPPNPPQVNSPLQTGYSAPHNLHHGSLSHGIEHQQHHIPTRQAESDWQSSIPAPVHGVLQPQLPVLPQYVKPVSWLSNDLPPLRQPPTLPTLPIYTSHTPHTPALEPGPRLAPINQPMNACDGNCEPGGCKGHARKNS
ncbi:hypothetical protein L207DRAFT_591727 [Hyaloscypha variabilis F]|uniref:Uncharacterized protein n=1 Tax=Hyaloscypha variabilis (strain UAMH 11265 / GT02V1 / F) TaxID=1149755 RepID=A0A2J6QYE6_HYAVF|nr:hypothetical protein L207DRAFT_591727 [Hyaloscypha variabilis F]